MLYINYLQAAQNVFQILGLTSYVMYTFTPLLSMVKYINSSKSLNTSDTVVNRCWKTNLSACQTVINYNI